MLFSGLNPEIQKLYLISKLALNVKDISGFPATNKPGFPGFDMVNTRNSLDNRLISISCSDPHCPFAPTLPQ